MDKPLGPQQMTFPRFILKFLAASAGGIIGAVLLVVIFLLASSLLSPLTASQPNEYISPVFVFILMVMVFLSSTIGNLVSTFLLSLTDRERYKRRASAMYQIFIVSIIIFLLMAPVYFITSSVDFSFTAYAIALHFILTAQVSALILEIVSNYRYSLVGLYGVTFSIILSAAVLFGLSSLVESPTILLFAAMPVVWGSIGLVHGIVTAVYGWIANIYDKDFLATNMDYGDDYGKEIVEEEKPKTKDEAGADFLKKKEE